MSRAASGFTTRITPSPASTIIGSRIRKPGSNNIPTETKNNTAKASRNGSASAAAWLLTGLCATTMPARKAPSAIDAPKKKYAAAATAMENTSTVSVNNSRERSLATCTKSGGMIRAPAHNTSTASNVSLPSASASEPHRVPLGGACASPEGAPAGSR